MKRIFLNFAAVFWLSIFSPSIFGAEAIPEPVWDAHHLRLIELQMEAIIIDMELPLTVEEEEEKHLFVQAQAAVSKLLNLKETLYQIRVHNDLESPRKGLSEQLNRLIVLYTDILEAKEDQLEEVWESFLDVRKQYFDSLSKIISQYQVRPHLPAAFSLEEESKYFFRESSDKGAFSESLFLMRGKKYEEAAVKLEALKAKHSDPIIQTILSLHLSDCYLMHESELSRLPDAPVKGWKYLEDALNSEVYHPFLYEVFYKWRTVNQMLHYGMSNFSTIPNARYNEERWKTYQRIKAHLQANPFDGWAMIQVGLLWELPNIERGGPVGNRNIEHWGLLYTAAEEQARAEEEMIPDTVVMQVKEKMGIT